ncbi:hypothetical protein C8R43DRAFT_959838 [Mycena crocata]|nr:hypothetical protein C8R43DRAFT_959838 [Mycena crocata]
MDNHDVDDAYMYTCGVHDVRQICGEERRGLVWMHFCCSCPLRASDGLIYGMAKKQRRQAVKTPIPLFQSGRGESNPVRLSFNMAKSGNEGQIKPEELRHKKTRAPRRVRTRGIEPRSSVIQREDFMATKDKYAPGTASDGYLQSNPEDTRCPPDLFVWVRVEAQSARNRRETKIVRARSNRDLGERLKHPKIIAIRGNEREKGKDTHWQGRFFGDRVMRGDQRVGYIEIGREFGGGEAMQLVERMTSNGRDQTPGRLRTIHGLTGTGEGGTDRGMHEWYVGTKGFRASACLVALGFGTVLLSVKEDLTVGDGRGNGARDDEVRELSGGDEAVWIGEDSRRLLLPWISFEVLPAKDHAKPL